MSAYSTVIQVRFGHVDPAGIAYFPRIFDYVHDVFEEVWEVHVGTRYYHLIQEQQIGFPLVHSDVDFHKPLRFGDRPVVSVTCFKIGRSSLGLRYRFMVGDEVHIEARMITVATHTDTMRPFPIPPEFRKRFEAILEPSSEQDPEESTRPGLPPGLPAGLPAGLPPGLPPGLDAGLDPGTESAPA